MTTSTLTRDAVYAALLELLTTGHHQAATPATLASVGDTRRTLATEHGTRDPTARQAPDERRLAALTQALGATAAALYTAQPWIADPARLYAALAELAAVALGWLDALPDCSDDGYDDEPEF